jgi:hypothetical protein
MNPYLGKAWSFLIDLGNLFLLVVIIWTIALAFYAFSVGLLT